MDEIKEQRLSRFISLILRHKPETINIKLDNHGWANVHELLDGINHTGRRISFEDLEFIVKNNKKNRYKFNEDKTKIRANQGHSIHVNVKLKEQKPPAILYHGTSDRFINSIISEGLKSMSRLYVHLSENIETAKNVGKDIRVI